MLTPKEEFVLEMLGAGLKVGEVSRIFGIPERKIENIRERVREKLQEAMKVLEASSDEKDN